MEMEEQESEARKGQKGWPGVYLSQEQRNKTNGPSRVWLSG